MSTVAATGDALHASPLGEDEVELIRAAEFPVLRDFAYFDTAASGVVPRAAVNAGQAAVRATAGSDFDFPGWMALLDRCRSNIGRLMQCSPADMALLASTGQGLNVVASGLSWSDGDEVIVHEREYPTGALVWLRLRRRGVTVRFVRNTTPGFTCGDFVQQMTPRTRAVMTSLVSFQDGFRADVEGLAQECRRRGVVLAVDAMQCLGVHPVHPAALGADAIAAGGGKYLLAGGGIGATYLSPELRERLEVSTAGWLSLEERGNPLLDSTREPAFAASARRFEGIPISRISAAMLAESTDLILAIGPDRISDRVNRLARTVAGELADAFPAASILPFEHRDSPVISFALPTSDAGEIAGKLRHDRIATSARAGRLRISLHFYNNLDDIRRLIAGLRKATG